MNNRGISLKIIHSYLAEFTSHIRQLNSSSFFDINKEAENISINLLNAIYGFNLKNANSILSANYPAIDLVDEEKGIVIQVTSESSNEKIIYTVDKFVKKNSNKNYKKLYIYVLTEKLSYYKTTKKQIEEIIGDEIQFSITENIIDNNTLGKKISSFTSIEKILNIENLLTLEFGRNKINLLTSKSNRQEKFKFDYRNRLTNFLGRETELGQLKEFISTESIFSWWIITGKAGSGKSRLALEFGYQSEAEGIQWGFLGSDQISTFDWNINYPRPTLLIVDYVQSVHTEVLRLIKNLENKSNYEHKFRLLLIERVVTGEWWNNFVNNIYASNSLFNEKPLELSGLPGDELFKIVERVLLNENSNLIVGKDKIISDLYNLDPLQRPLFAMFAGIALAKNQPISSWNQYNLLDFIIDEDYRLTKKTFSQYDDVFINKHRNLLSVSTVCYGLTGFNIDRIFEEGLTWLPTADEYDNELYDFISYGSNIEDQNKWIPEYQVIHSDPSLQEIQIFPLIPDVLGEYFVLKNFSVDSRFRYRHSNKLEQFISLVESLNFYYYSIFIRRLLQDYPEHNIVINFLVGNKNSFIDNRGSSGHLVLESMKYLHYKDLDCLKTLWSYTKVLSETVNNRTEQKGFLDDPDRVYQEACQIMVYRNVDNPDEQEKYYNIMIDNTNRFDLNPKTFVDAGYSHEEEFDIDEARELYKKMDDPEFAKEYILKKTVSDERIPHLEVLAINCILLKGVSKGKPDIANKYIDRVFYLCKRFSYPRIKLDTLITFIEYGPNNIKDFNAKIDDLFKEILLTPPQVSAVNILQEQFKFAKELIEHKVSAQESYNAINYFIKFKNHLLTLKPNNNVGNIFVKLSLIALNIAKQFYERNIFITGDLFYNEIINISNIINIPPHPMNPINEILIKANNYRNRNFY